MMFNLDDVPSNRCVLDPRHSSGNTSLECCIGRKTSETLSALVKSYHNVQSSLLMCRICSLSTLLCCILLPAAVPSNQLARTTVVLASTATSVSAFWIALASAAAVSRIFRESRFGPHRALVKYAREYVALGGACPSPSVSGGSQLEPSVYAGF
jgi:hypothetical protein